MCPSELFSGSKEEIGPCPNIHDARLRKAYIEASQTADFGYERELERVLEQILVRAEKAIARSRERVAEEIAAAGGIPNGVVVPGIDIDHDPELAELNFAYDDKVAEHAAAIESGDIERAAALEEEVETARRTRCDATAILLLSRVTDDAVSTAGGRQRLRVCNVCGSFISLTDSRERISDHFGGRGHLGYVAVRTKLRNIREWRRARVALGGDQPFSALAQWAMSFPPGSPGAIAAAAAATARDAERDRVASRSVPSTNVSSSRGGHRGSAPGRW
jgi:RNA-binding protein Luc7-like 2